MTDTSISDYTVKVRKDQSLTSILKEMIEKMKNKNPDGIFISDDKITHQEWINVMTKLDEINNKRKSEGEASIFTGGNDKTRGGWRNSYIIKPGEEITFKKEELEELFTSMGVSITPPKNKNPKVKIDNLQGAVIDSALVVPVKENPKTPVDTTETVVKDDSKKAGVVSGKESPRLSWREIGQIALKSTKNFVKNMFCDENGFSLKKTAATVGIIAGLALAAPAAAAAGASAAVVGTVAAATKLAGAALTVYMGVEGGKNIYKGTKDYYNAATKDEAKEAMEQAWDGGVEIASIPVLGGLMKTSGKLVGKAQRSFASRSTRKAEKAEIRKAENARKAEEAQKAKEAKEAEKARKAEEAQKAKEAKEAEKARKAEEAQKAKEAKEAEKARKAAEAQKAKEAKRAQKAAAKKSKKSNKISYEEYVKAREAKRAELEARAADEFKKAEETFNKPLDHYTEDNVYMEITSEGHRPIHATGKNTLYLADTRRIMNAADKTTDWIKALIYNYDELKEFCKVKRFGGTQGQWSSDASYIIYRPVRDLTTISYCISGRGGDNITISFDGKVPEAKCLKFIEFMKKEKEFNLDKILDFMNNN